MNKLYFMLIAILCAANAHLNAMTGEEDNFEYPAIAYGAAQLAQRGADQFGLKLPQEILAKCVGSCLVSGVKETDQLRQVRYYRKQGRPDLALAVSGQRDNIRTKRQLKRKKMQENGELSRITSETRRRRLPFNFNLLEDEQKFGDENQELELPVSTRLMNLFAQLD